MYLSQLEWRPSKLRSATQYFVATRTSKNPGVGATGGGDGYKGGVDSVGDGVDSVGSGDDGDGVGVSGKSLKNPFV